MEKTILISQCFEKKILLSHDIFTLNNFEESLNLIINSETESLHSSLLTLNKDSLSLLCSSSESLSEPFDPFIFDQIRTKFEKNQETEEYLSYLNNLKSKIPIQLLDNKKYPTNILFSHPHQQPKKYEVKDFTSIFISRYKFLSNLLRNRQELTNTLSINKLLTRNEKEKVSLIGAISEINQTHQGNLIFTLEDPTGQIKVIVNKNNPVLYNSAKELVFDEIIGVTGTSQGKAVFADGIVWPEIPVNQELKKTEEEIYAIFLSDVHVGSTNFLAEEFGKFLTWIKGETGNEKQKEIAQKIKYLFIVGDIVDGVGIYPGQDKELEIKDITQQYQAAADLLKEIPQHIQIIICPGNHDALPLAEPQPAFNLRYASSLLKLPNLVLVSNPALINIAKTENFSGFDVLIYHGYSFDYYVDKVDALRSAGGYNRADLIMKFLLKRRHLAPSFSSTPYLPSQDDDLLIKKVPDFFITGHIHYSNAANYRGVTMINGSCWQSKTSFQEKVGHEPQPARVPVVNLKTREIKILKFI